MKFWNCSKTLVNDLADFSSTWTGYYAQYFEDCNQSNNAEIILMEKEYREAVEDKLYSGTTDAKSESHCVGFGGTTSSASREDPASLVAKMAYKTFFNWAVQTYPDSFVQ